MGGLRRFRGSRRAERSFYIVRFGVRPDRMQENYQVYDGTELTVRSLNVGVGYSFTVDAVNDSGLTQGREFVTIR